MDAIETILEWKRDYSQHITGGEDHEDWWVLLPTNATKNDKVQQSPRLVTNILGLDHDVFANSLYRDKPSAAQNSLSNRKDYIMHKLDLLDHQVSFYKQQYIAINFCQSRTRPRFRLTKVPSSWPPPWLKIRANPSISSPPKTEMKQAPFMTPSPSTMQTKSTKTISPKSIIKSVLKRFHRNDRVKRSKRSRFEYDGNDDFGTSQSKNLAYDFYLSTDPFKKSKYNVLGKSIRLPTSLESNEDKELLGVLLYELHTLYKESRQPMSFKHRNNTQGNLVNIPQYTSLKTLKKKAQAKDSWMQSTLDILVKGETSKNAAAEGFTWSLAASYPEEFKSVAEANRFEITKRLEGHEAIAIAIDAGITMSQLMKVFKHLRYHYSDDGFEELV